jgi:hypothetical protein
MRISTGCPPVGKGGQPDGLGGQKTHKRLVYPQGNPQGPSTSVHKLGKDFTVASDVTLEHPGLGLNSGGQIGDLVKQTASLGHELANLPIGMHDGGVVASTESLANLR